MGALLLITALLIAGVISLGFIVAAYLRDKLGAEGFQALLKQWGLA